MVLIKRERCSFVGCVVLATRICEDAVACRDRCDDRLSTREREVLMWVAGGKTTFEIGAILGISAHTVGEHLKNIRRKLDTNNNTHSVFQAFKTGQLLV